MNECNEQPRGTRPAISRPIQTACVVIPIYNEEETLPVTYARLKAVADASPGRDFRFLFVNDGSSDRSRELLDNLAADHPEVIVLHFARNFGHQHAVTAGIDYADADAVCLIDGDLQDPPELLPAMIDYLEAGYDIVYGQRTSRAQETWFKRFTAKAFYRLLYLVTNVDIPMDTGDFRVMRRDVSLVLRDMRETHRFLRGMVAWTGFHSRAFPYDREARFAGVTKYPFRKMLRFALNAIFSFSDLPLRLANYLGVLVTLFGLGGMTYIVVARVFFGRYLEGVSATLFAVLAMGGVQLVCMGILGEYVGRIFAQSKNRPLYIIASGRNCTWQPVGPPSTMSSISGGSDSGG